MENIILEILNSKRLFADHIDILEQALIDLNKDNNTKSNVYSNFTSIKYGSLIVSSATVTFLLQKRLPAVKYLSAIVLGGYSTFCLIEFIKNFKKLFIGKQMKLLLRAVNDFDVNIRRNMAYFKEASILNQQLLQSINGSTYETALVEKSIKNALKITILLADCLNELESFDLPSKYDNIYEKIESLDNCELFTKPINELGSNHLKDIYNVFLYIQSQFFTRLGLSIVYNTTKVKIFLREYCTKIVKPIDSFIDENTALRENLTNFKSIESKIKIFRSQNNDVSEPLTILRSYSLSLTARMLAVADGCQNIDSTIQDISAKLNGELNGKHRRNLEGLLPSLRLLENALLLCQDDYQRFQLAYFKYVHLPDPSCMEAIDQSCEDQWNRSNEKKYKIIDDDDDEDDLDREFFAQVDLSKEDDELTNDQTSRTPFSIDEQLNNVDSKFVRKQFKPVLKQLKDKLSPIKHSMQTRERNYLQSKGLPIDIVIDPSEQHNSNCDSAASSSTDDDDDDKNEKLQIKKFVNRQKYDEMRTFFQEKQQINLMQMQPNTLLPSILSQRNDDILE